MFIKLEWQANFHFCSFVVSLSSSGFAITWIGQWTVFNIWPWKRCILLSWSAFSRRLPTFPSRMMVSVRLLTHLEPFHPSIYLSSYPFIHVPISLDPQNWQPYYDFWTLILDVSLNYPSSDTDPKSFESQIDPKIRNFAPSKTFWGMKRCLMFACLVYIHIVSPSIKPLTVWLFDLWNHESILRSTQLVE